MDFAQRRALAIAEVKSRLREKISLDKIFMYAWRCTERESGLEHWLFTIAPHQCPKKLRKTVAQNGKDAWNPDGIGADMDELGWQTLQHICAGNEPDLESLAGVAARNLHTLVGIQTAARLLEAAGTLKRLAFLTQRDCECLGSGSNQQSILRCHELATTQRALRVLASRVVLAARLDQFGSDRFKGESFREEVLYAQ